MSVLDKLMNIMKLDDGDEYDDDFLMEEEEYDSYEEKPAKKGFFNKFKGNNDFDKEEEAFTPAPSRTNNQKVTSIRQPASRRGVSMEVRVLKPTSVEDSRDITETLLSGRTVILNLEGLDLEVAQRIIDFTSGATYAIRGNLQKVSSYIFLVTPTNVDISGDLQDLLNSSFDASSIRTRY